MTSPTPPRVRITSPRRDAARRSAAVRPSTREIDEDTGLADVEDSRGRTYALPAEWLPRVADGAAYRVGGEAGHLTFTPDPTGARELRERSKQTLLDFADEPGADEPGDG